MKKFVMMMAMFLFLAPAFGLAADVRTAETIGKDEKVSNLYLAGQNPTVDAGVTGDLVVAGGVVTVNGDVSGGVFAAGSTLNLNGAVKESLRVAGGAVTVDGAVGGDVVIFGGNVVLGTKSVVTGDVIVFGGTLDLKGSVLGSVKKSYAGNVNLSGSVAGDVTFSRVGALVVTSGAVVGGSLKYSSQNEGTVSADARVAGKVEYTKIQAQSKVKTMVPNLGSVLFGLLMAFITLVVFIKLLPKFAGKVVGEVLVDPWKKAGIGFLAIVVTPIALLALLITLIGWGVMGYLFLLYGAFVTLTGTFTALFAGSFAWKYLRKGTELEVSWKTAAVGVVLVALLKLIPIVGWLAVCLIAFMVFGTLTMMGFEYLKAQRV